MTTEVGFTTKMTSLRTSTVYDAS